MRRRWRVLGGAVAVAFIALNAVAYFHAGAMTRWAAEGEPTARPEDLGFLERAHVLLTGVSIPRPTNHLTPASVGLAFETYTFGNGRGDVLEAWYVPHEGATELALLFHGYAAQKDALLGVAKGFTELGCAVALVDFHGSGGSSGSGTELGMTEAADVKAAVDDARRRWPELALVLYGQSMGGASILRAIAEFGVEPDAIVVESTFDRLLSTVRSRFHRMGLPATPFAQLLVFWGSVRLGMNAFTHEPVEFARSVRCPALVLQGDRDPNITVEQARAIHANLSGWKRYSEFTKTGHQDVRMADRARWTEDVSALLAEVRAR